MEGNLDGIAVGSIETTSTGVPLGSGLSSPSSHGAVGFATGKTYGISVGVRVGVSSG
jgi:hypothetical protein